MVEWLDCLMVGAPDIWDSLLLAACWFLNEGLVIDSFNGELKLKKIVINRRDEQLT